ncbi:MAG TPA: dynamin family protein [Patescibacteria group bacterium]|nr:dynamin family protein [Patescibacteria group bacterium]
MSAGTPRTPDAARAGSRADGSPGYDAGEPAAPSFLDPCLARLDAAIDAARALGVPTDDAGRVRADAAARLGFPADAFVIALVGGTGVGKSSLLNALAGSEVSPASVRRPTTARPVAWIPGPPNAALRPLLDWLGVERGDAAPSTETTPRPATMPGTPPSLAILDLPDLDSIALEHRRRVDAVLPRVDAVIWVTDPEKYHDALLHDEILQRWLPRLGRQLVVVNKADRLSTEDGERLRRDLERDVVRLASGFGHVSDRPRVVLASAQGADAGGLVAVRAWLDEGVEAKQVVRARLTATIRSTIAGLAGDAGIEPSGDASPILGTDARRMAALAASEALLRVVDLSSLRRQAIGATRARARARGAGPLGGLTSRLFRWSGRQARVADPGAYLARWRDRGTAGPAAGAVRAALAEPLRLAAPGTRRLLAASTSVVDLERGLGTAVDRAIAADPGEPPTSAWWTVIGLAQTVATGALVLSAIWVFLWALIKFPADSVVLPVIGQAPAPFVAIVVSLVAGYVLARLLGAHAGWLGRRWAGHLADRIRANVRTEVGTVVFAPVDALEAARAILRTAARTAAEDCRQG